MKTNKQNQSNVKKINFPTTYNIHTHICTHAVAHLQGTLSGCQHFTTHSNRCKNKSLQGKYGNFLSYQTKCRMCNNFSFFFVFLLQKNILGFILKVTHQSMKKTILNNSFFLHTGLNRRTSTCSHAVENKRPSKPK